MAYMDQVGAMVIGDGCHHGLGHGHGHYSHGHGHGSGHGHVKEETFRKVTRQCNLFFPQNRPMENRTIIHSHIAGQRRIDKSD